MRAGKKGWDAGARKGQAARKLNQAISTGAVDTVD
jgi:hypothetical protein